MQLNKEHSVKTYTPKPFQFLNKKLKKKMLKLPNFFISKAVACSFFMPMAHLNKSFYWLEITYCGKTFKRKDYLVFCSDYYKTLEEPIEKTQKCCMKFPFRKIRATY